ncbi:hypothetical protein CAG99_17360 [Streptomyces marincola]|uniref:Uncharacterized protein n=1 Tax=Streptomyces marincola TaxID=2878388 RepID=A0A1W7CZZ5_9ACTN|nr:hypothetical protein CAG99_17360 [Streptomyces marincola]
MLTGSQATICYSPDDSPCGTTSARKVFKSTQSHTTGHGLLPCNPVPLPSPPDISPRISPRIASVVPPVPVKDERVPGSVAPYAGQRSGSQPDHGRATATGPADSTAMGARLSVNQPHKPFLGPYGAKW